MPPKTIDVHVVTTSRGSRLVPGLVIADVGDTINWINDTQDDVFLLVPHEGFLGNPVSGNPSPHHHQKIGAGNQHAKGPVQNPPGARRNFPYAVFCKETGSFAIGNSDPEIIVP